MATEAAFVNPSATDPTGASPAPEAGVQEPFRSEITRARLGLIDAAQKLDATSAIAHARALRSALYRAANFRPNEW
ncbi:MAG: hypothetical protein QM692_03405 [Thermomicrobiales bacterium]